MRDTRVVCSTRVPGDSEISMHLADARFFDAFAVSLEDDRCSALQICIEIMASTPTWINFLMRARNKAVALFGLKNLGHLNNVDIHREPSAYRVGDKVGIFSILFLSEQEVILIETDKHLDAKVSLSLSEVEGQGKAVVMTTVIHVHKLLGHIYILLVWPLHKLMFPAMLARFARRRQEFR